MILLTQSLRAQLLANGKQPDTDHVPVVKFFSPIGAGVWLATELDADGDIMFGLADLGYPELGTWSLSELAELRLPLPRVQSTWILSRHTARSACIAPLLRSRLLTLCLLWQLHETRKQKKRP